MCVSLCPSHLEMLEVSNQRRRRMCQEAWHPQCGPLVCEISIRKIAEGLKGINYVSLCALRLERPGLLHKRRKLTPPMWCIGVSSKHHKYHIEVKGYQICVSVSFMP